MIMANQAGLAEDGVDERVLWVGRPPSKSGEMKSIGVFADQLRSAWQRSSRFYQG